MKKLSIKLRVTLWFTAFMMLIVVVVSLFLLLTGKRIATISAQNKLMETVEDSFENFERNKKELGFPPFEKGVYLSLYDMEGNQILGEVPTEFDNYLPFEENEVHIVKSNDETWYVYDKLQKKKHQWVRGILSVEGAYDHMDIMLHLFVYTLPLLVIAVAVGGYYIISRGFRPINSIIAAAEKIGEGKDLSQRIHLGEGKDEIYTLAQTFDGMFERLEGFFEKEKQFTSDASHELRTPTSVIISQCEFALENANTVEEAKEALSKVLEQARKMSSMIAQLLTLARMDKGQSLKLNLEQISISELTEIVIEQQSELAQEKNIVIHKKIEPNLMLHADETMLMRMMINLIENGINYGGDGGRVQVNLFKENQNIIFKVTDYGVGIASEHIHKIWERFYQVDAARNSANNSVGLGLSMVKLIAEAHGGDVFVKSEVGKETTFTVALPVDKNN